ncbi:acylphosphatase [Chromohalobacter japonicus]|uniref:acylphosphatase n=1 Tax=Chromohalobacter japonicus TaxID=223900 RepID=UPI0006943CD3|nr:acylphosphatase [Chromohalobacter japonicus]
MAKPNRYRPTAANTRPKPLRSGLEAEQRADALVDKARDAQQAGKDAEAVQALTAALKLDPLHINAQALQARLLAKHGKLNVAIPMMQNALLQQPDDVENAFLYARWLAQTGKIRLALAAMHRCVQLRPNHDAPRRYLAALYGTLGYDEHSRYWARKAVNSKAIAVREAKVETRLTVLALFTQASGSLGVNRKTFGIHTSEGHNNLSGLLDSDYITVIRLHVDTLDQQPELLRKLPAADVIYNSITDPERCEHALHLAQKVCDRLDLPVINPPSLVLGASREGNYDRFKDNPGIILPKSVKLEGVQGECKPFVEQAMQAHGFHYPILVRVSGYQNGRYMQKIDDLASHDLSEIDALTQQRPETLYVVQYHDVSVHDERAPDKPLYPKYRAFLINGELYPTHVRFGYGDWNVHMPEHRPTIKRFPWLYEWEERFFTDPAATLPEGQWETLRQAMQAVGLDYLGVDFAVITEPDNAGKLIVFEANAAMRNFLDQLEQDIPAHTASRKAILAAHDLFAERGDVEPWDYQLPAGHPNPAQALLENTAASSETRHLLIRGHVVDVGYREWFWHQLHQHRLQGWVRQAGDQQVEAVVAGPWDRLEHLKTRCEEGPAAARVDAVEMLSWSGDVPVGARVLERAEPNEMTGSA